jgi:prevent-host-death family protein
MARKKKSVSATEFKANCLRLVDRVRESHEEFVVTRHGKPVARLVPVEPEDVTQRSFFGSMRGTVLRYDRPFDPVPGEWDANKGILLNDDEG